jgi:hypothetical protein
LDEVLDRHTPGSQRHVRQCGNPRRIDHRPRPTQGVHNNAVTMRARTSRPLSSGIDRARQSAHSCADERSSCFWVEVRA